MLHRHIFFVFEAIIISLICSCSMTAKKDALRTVAEADSLDHAGVLFSDTLRLQEAADAFYSFLNRTEKAKALYYLGRNYSVKNEDATAVDYYIAADRLKPKDAQLRGRLNGNMAYICKQQNKDSLALIMYNRTIPFYESANDTLRLLSIALDASLAYCNVNDFQAADSVWNKIISTNLNTYHHSRAMGIRAYYYNSFCKYDSALYYLNKVESPQALSLDFYNAQRAIALFYTEKPDSAVWYANNILEYNSSYRNKIIAYNVLREKAYIDKDIATAQKMHDFVEEMQNHIDIENETRIRAIAKIEDYLLHPRTPLTLADKLLIALAAFLLVLFSIIVFFVKKKSRKTIRDHENSLMERENRVAQHTQKEQLQIAERKQILENNIAKVRKSLSAKSFAQGKEAALFQEINAKFFQLIDKLESKRIFSVVELKFLIVVLLDYDYSTISEYMNCARNGISKTKKRIAAKLGTTGAKLHDTLIELSIK